MKIDLSSEEIDLLIDASWELYDNTRDNKKYIQENRERLIGDFREDGRCLYNVYYKESLEAEKNMRDLIMKLYGVKEDK